MRNRKELISALEQRSLAIEKRENGITLIALVVTIVVLLILAGITIASFTGDEGIFNETKEIANSIEDLQNKTIDDLHQIANELSSSAGDALNPGEPGNPDNPGDSGDSTVDNIVDKVQDDTVTVQDENGNKITIPGGFRVLSHGTKNSDIDEVVYNYSPNHKPCVQDGIVIADAEDNQFVWIPVGEIKNKDNTTTTITLGRYTFDATSGMPNLHQAAYTEEKPNNYTQNISLINYYSYIEPLAPRTLPPDNAKDLEDFVIKTKLHEGYYLARYEASGGNGDDTNNKVKSKYDKVPWNNIHQYTASANARNMYSEDSYVESDLINSYSWDTALVYIQKYSGNSNYSNKKTENSSMVNTGKGTDEVCNIHNLASNCSEWSTEYSNSKFTGAQWICVYRGGDYEITDRPTSARGNCTYTYYRESTSFRAILYVK